MKKSVWVSEMADDPTYLTLKIFIQYSIFAVKRKGIGCTTAAKRILQYTGKKDVTTVLFTASVFDSDTVDLDGNIYI